MKNRIILFVFGIFFSCEKDPVSPVGKGNFINVITIPVNNIQDSRAISGINITNLGSQYTIQERGICWGTASNPTISDTYVLSNSNNVSIPLYDLIQGKKYYVRSFIKFNGIYSYGNQQEFTTSLTNSNLLNGLVTYLPLNGDSNDYSSSQNTLTGLATKGPGRFGLNNTAYTFNGINNFLTILSPKNLPVNNSTYSISVWFRAMVWNKEMAIMGYGPSNVSRACNYVKTMTTRGLMHYHWNLDNLFTSSSFLGQWIHLVITYDGLNERYYINGQQISSWSRSSNSLIINPNILSIGARVVSAQNNNISEYFNGSIDEVRIYNRVLNSNEVFVLFNL